MKITPQPEISMKMTTSCARLPGTKPTREPAPKSRCAPGINPVKAFLIDKAIETV